MYIYQTTANEYKYMRSITHTMIVKLNGKYWSISLTKRQSFTWPKVLFMISVVCKHNQKIALRNCAWTPDHGTHCPPKWASNVNSATKKVYVRVQNDTFLTHWFGRSSLLTATTPNILDVFDIFTDVIASVWSLRETLTTTSDFKSLYIRFLTDNVD